MLDKKLKEVLEILGGKAVLKEQDQYYILLTLKEFKKINQSSIEGLTKQGLVDKINNDIANWKVMQEEKNSAGINLDEIAEEKSEEIRYEKTLNN